MNRQKKDGGMKITLLVGTVILFSYFSSEAVLRQFVLHRAGGQSITLSSLLGKLPPGIRDEVTRKVTIAEYRDELKNAKNVNEKIRISIALADAISPQELQKTYAEIIDKYPQYPEAQSAFVNFLAAKENALRSISVSRYHKFINLLKGEPRLSAWSSGFFKLKSLNVPNKTLLEYLMPLLKMKPDGHEYAQLYVALSELAFQEENQDIELKAKKLEEYCETLPFFSEVLAKRAKAEAQKRAGAAAKKKAAAKQQTGSGKK
ncbi:MAG: hypothetical protein PHV82_10180 [Victivallaceae bacterium]|nr:hypothetical protein [Victivallaceae bacterium]